MSDTSQGPGWWLASDGRWYPPQTWSGPPAQTTNGFAVASLACACGGFFFLGIPSILGIVFGFIARSQIRRSGGRQGGDGLALAGIIVGFAFVALAIGIVVLIIVLVAHTHPCADTSDAFNCSVD